MILLFKQKMILIARRSYSLFSLSLFVTFFLLSSSYAYGSTKIFSGSGDGTLWHDDNNWSEPGVPGIKDDVKIDLADATVKTNKDFSAKSISVSGKTTSTWQTENFVYGTITPDSNKDNAILIRKNGTVILQGAGVITVKGSFKNSEEQLPTEPSPMVVLK